MTTEERLDKMETLVDALMHHQHMPNGEVAIDIQCVEDVLYEGRRQKAIEEEKRKKEEKG